MDGSCRCHFSNIPCDRRRRRRGVEAELRRCWWRLRDRHTRSHGRCLVHVDCRRSRRGRGRDGLEWLLLHATHLRRRRQGRVVRRRRAELGLRLRWRSISGACLRWHGRHRHGRRWRRWQLRKCRWCRWWNERWCRWQRRGRRYPDRGWCRWGFRQRCSRICGRQVPRRKQSGRRWWRRRWLARRWRRWRQRRWWRRIELSRHACRGIDNLGQRSHTGTGAARQLDCSRHHGTDAHRRHPDSDERNVEHLRRVDVAVADVNRRCDLHQCVRGDVHDDHHDKRRVLPRGRVAIEHHGHGLGSVERDQGDCPRRCRLHPDGEHVHPLQEVQLLRRSADVHRAERHAGGEHFLRRTVGSRRWRGLLQLLVDRHGRRRRRIRQVEGGHPERERGVQRGGRRTRRIT